ncbi:hypothetical protein BDV3_002535 [Batrachochytrium dendrobatidis]|nr:hypothetical protein QVD99_003002 [Batrachochytrium dendrobatidis]
MNGYSGNKKNNTKQSSFSHELVNPGNTKILFHGGFFAVAAWFLATQADMFHF